MIERDPKQRRDQSVWEKEEGGRSRSRSRSIVAHQAIASHALERGAPRAPRDLGGDEVRRGERRQAALIDACSSRVVPACLPCPCLTYA